MVGLVVQGKQGKFTEHRKVAFWLDSEEAGGGVSRHWDTAE